MPDGFDDPEKMGGDDGESLSQPPSFFPYQREDEVRARPTFGELVETRVEGVFLAENAGQVSRFVLLSDGERKLPILIGIAEAAAIQMAFESAHADRPMTHDLAKTVIERLGADLDRIVIDDYWNAVYYAKLYLQVGKEQLEIDARPSDAIALAIRFDAPIFVADGILDHAMDD